MVLIGDLGTKNYKEGVEKGRCPQSNEEENEIHILLKCKETQTWRSKFLRDKYL
jgi:hypothetical protein